jgi:hypothetical protein
MNDQVMYQNYLKGLLKKAQVARRSRTHKQVGGGLLWPTPCVVCRVEEVEAVYDAEQRITWMCRQHRREHEMHAPGKTVAVRLQEMKIEFDPFDKWLARKAIRARDKRK